AGATSAAGVVRFGTFEFGPALHLAWRIHFTLPHSRYNDAMAGPKSFTLHIPDADIADLRARLARTRWPDEPPLAAWSTGASLGYVKSLTDYWQSGFDWRAWEAKLNGFRQFTIPIRGIDLHFIHAPSRKADAMPLLISHGWPGS